MSELDELREAAAGLAEGGWPALEEAGMTLVGIPEQAGGSGGTPPQAAAVLGAAAGRGTPLPLAETALAAWLLAAAGLPIPRGPLTAAAADLEVRRDGDAAFLTGTLDRVPYATKCARLVILTGGLVAVVDPAACVLEPARNLAAEPRDTVRLDAVRAEHATETAAEAGVDAAGLARRLAAARLVQIAGAGRRVLALTIEHVTTRVQFGRPLSRFQAVQQRVAAITGELRVLEACAELAVAEVDSPLLVAAAVASGYDAAGVVAAHAHQLLGAMGFTREHDLHLATTRIWAWRQELGPLAGWLETVAAEAPAPLMWARLAQEG